MNTDLMAAFGGAYGHDTWTEFLAGATGKVVFLPNALVYYRQHGSNAVGASSGVGRREVIKRSAHRSISDYQQAFKREIRKARLRAALLDELSDRSKGKGCCADGPAIRRAMWLHHEMVMRRRAELYMEKPGSLAAVRRLFRNATSRDYGRRTCGGLGLPSLVRDLAGFSGINLPTDGETPCPPRRVHETETRPQ